MSPWNTVNLFSWRSNSDFFPHIRSLERRKQTDSICKAKFSTVFNFIFGYFQNRRKSAVLCRISSRNLHYSWSSLLIKPLVGHLVILFTFCRFFLDWCEQKWIEQIYLRIGELYEAFFLERTAEASWGYILWPWRQHWTALYIAKSFIFMNYMKKGEPTH
mgnify:FL=1